MTETKGDYLGNTVTCARCGCEIGRIVNIGGVELLEIGDMTVRFIAANHAKNGCGEPFHWTVEGGMLQRLIAKNGTIET